MSMGKNKGIESKTLYDLDMVEKMCRGKHSTILKMVNTFITTMTMGGLEIEQAWEKMDLQAIQNIVHRIKPTLAIYGITSLEKNILQLETVGNDPASFNDLKSSVENINTVIAQVVTDLKNKYFIN